MINDLFPDVARRKRRKLMHVTDAGPGNPNWAAFACKCGYKTQCGNVSETELRRGRPCPQCNREPSICKNCQQPGVYIRTRNFERGATADVWMCKTEGCKSHQLYWHVNKPPNEMNNEKQDPQKPDRILKADCSQEDFGVFNWAARQKPKRNMAEFLREALEEKVEREAAESRKFGALPEYVSDWLAKMKANRLAIGSAGSVILDCPKCKKVHFRLDPSNQYCVVCGDVLLVPRKT